MADKRKLQGNRPQALFSGNLSLDICCLVKILSLLLCLGEIDRCLKKVSEGVEQFEDIWQKVHSLETSKSGSLGRTIKRFKVSGC